jgi:hypothetical protein
MELFNELPDNRLQSVEDFLAFIPIYESKRRTNSLAALIKRHKKQIEGKICMEAGAGKGLFSRLMAEMGAQEVLAVERSELLYQLLCESVEAHPQVQCHFSDITDFIPHGQVDLLFHELYGPLVLDETILALRRLKFKPGLILPDGGRLWAMPISEKTIKEADDQYDQIWADELAGALVSDLVMGVPFVHKWEVFSWTVESQATVFEFEIPENADFLALCGEITHQGKSVLKMWWTHNWPVIYTPVAGKRFKISFEYVGGYTKVFFDWIA